MNVAGPGQSPGPSMNTTGHLHWENFGNILYIPTFSQKKIGKFWEKYKMFLKFSLGGIVVNTVL